MVAAKYYPTIQSGAVVRFALGYDEGDGERSAEINVSRDGVSIQGRWPIYNSAESIEEIKATLNAAYGLYLEMDRHSDPHAVAKAFVKRHNETQS